MIKREMGVFQLEGSRHTLRNQVNILHSNQVSEIIQNVLTNSLGSHIENNRMFVRKMGNSNYR